MTTEAARLPQFLMVAGVLPKSPDELTLAGEHLPK
jgi:hypothetical protein